MWLARPRPSDCGPIVSPSVCPGPGGRGRSEAKPRKAVPFRVASSETHRAVPANKRLSLRLLAGLLLLALPGWLAMTARGAEPRGQRPKRPNILWITSEDNGPFLGCYGDRHAQTPNLDRLAAQGIRFTNAVANAPVCAPTRCTIITGVYAPSMGTQHMRSTNRIPSSIRLFPQYLRQAGYFCTNHSKTDYNLSPVDKNAWNMISGGDHRRREPGQPFFAVYNLGTTHESSLHRGGDPALADSDIPLPPYHPDTPELRASWATYYRIITRMDAQVGEILQQLEDEGVADDTIVFYYSDHGGILPRSKRFLYDTGVHVPMIVRFGKNVAHLAPQAPGTACDRPVAFVDLAPTILSLVGLPIPQYMQGRAFLGPQATEAPEYSYCFRGRMDERYDMFRAVRGKRFKYIRNYMPHRIYGQHIAYLFRAPAMQSWLKEYQAGHCRGPQCYFWHPKPVEELYDFIQDPWEVNNLADDPQYAQVLQRMRRANRQHLLRIRDAGFLTEAEMVARAEAAGKTIYEMVRDPKLYPLETIMAAAELASEGKPENLPRLQELLGHKDSGVRYWAATGCVILGTKAEPASDGLRKLLEDPSPSVRIAAAEALCRTGHTDDGLPVLIELAGETGARYALHAVNVLEEIGPSARPALGVLERAAKASGYVGRAAQFTFDKLRAGAP